MGGGGGIMGGGGWRREFTCHRPHNHDSVLPISSQQCQTAAGSATHSPAPTSPWLPRREKASRGHGLVACSN